MRSDSPAAPADILDELLAPPSGMPTPGQEALARLIRRAVPAVSRTPVPAPPAVIAPPVHPPHAKIKTTQYFDPETCAALSRVKAALGRSGRRRDFGRISKTRIVETALRRSLEEFEAKGLASRLCRDLETAKGES